MLQCNLFERGISYILAVRKASNESETKNTYVSN